MSKFKKIDFIKYNIDEYLLDIDSYGLKNTWHNILSQILNFSEKLELFAPENFGELYEIGLEHDNKISKKEMGKYYTPRDVADIMSEWLLELDGKNVCDVGCGVGNLILSYLNKMKFDDAYKLIDNGNLYLYDKDSIALEICKYTIAIKYGKELLGKINAKHCDFLDKKIKLPKNCKVISNPPYYKISNISSTWNVTKIISDSKELYSAFIEKIIKNSKTSVIITPYSFIGAQKFYSLRLEMSKYNGFIISFDNVPGNIFCGKKHGIFNSNNTNSVRAAITVVENKADKEGFRLSPLIRFKTDERNILLKCNILEKLISARYQTIDSKNRNFYKCFIDLESILDQWNNKSNKKLGDYIQRTSKSNNKPIYIPTTCRYFTVGSSKNLSRDGKRIIYVDREYYDYLYCLMNSTFGYWYWRLYDGGINCPLTIINRIPVFYDIASDEQKQKIHKIAKEMMQNEDKYLVYKKNASKMQENIKFPIKYRNDINKIFFEILGIDEDVSVLDKIHSSRIFEKELEDENE